MTSSEGRRVVLVGVFACYAALGVGSAPARPSDDKPAATMHDLRDHFAACFQPPRDAAGTRVTFYFALNNRGRVLAQPRTTWLGFKGSEDEKLRRLAGFESAFEKCLPLLMSDKLAETIPGKVYFLQYIVADKGDSSQVLLRPFGSHYFGGGESAPGFVPLVPERRFAPIPTRPPVEVIRQPPIRTFRPFVGPLPQLLRRARSQARLERRPYPTGRRFR